jgi:tRNA(fMet)-specific endonuclease VapC
MTHLLDTDISSFVMKRSHPALIERVRGFAAGDLKVSAVTAFELEFGARRSGRYPDLMRVITAFLENVEVIPFDLSAAQHAGEIRLDLAAAGQPIGAYDLLIAGHARSRGFTLVTHNVSEFSRVERLEIEDWANLPSGTG